MDNKQLDIHIRELFEARWVGEHVLSSLENMELQLYKTLTDQMNGFWSGHTAYHLAVDGDFLVDAPSTKGLKKGVTKLGVQFMSRHESKESTGGSDD